MASCLRNLPAEARSLIDEMGQHWRDLERLKATGGTPTALIMKGLRVGRAKDGAMAFAVRNQEDYIRNVVCNPRNRCWMCDYDRAIGEIPMCAGHGDGRIQWFIIDIGVDHRVHAMLESRRWRAAREW